MAKRRKSYYGGASKFFFGWFVGAIITLALIVGIGYWVIFCMPVGSAASLVGADVPLSEEAKQQSVAGFVSTAIQSMNGSSNDSIEVTVEKFGIKLDAVLTVSGEGDNKTYSYKGLDITDIIKGKFSEISTNANKVVNKLSINDICNITGISLPADLPVINDERIKSSAIKDLGATIQDVVNNYTLSDIADQFGVTGLTNNDLLKNIVNKKLGELSEAINDLKVKDVITIGEDDKILSAIKDIKIVELGTHAEAEIKKLKIEDVIDVGDNNVLKAIKGFKIGELADKFETLKVIDIFPDPAEGETDTRNKVIVAIKNIALKDLGSSAAEDAVKDLTIADFVEVGDNKILNKIKDLKISQLATDAEDEIKSMYIEDIIDIDDDDKILGSLKGLKISELGTDAEGRVKNLLIKDVIDIDEDDKILGAIKNLKISELATEAEPAIKNLTVRDVLGTIDEDNKVLSAIADTSINGLAGKIETLQVQEIVTVGDNPILQAIATTPVNELGSRMGTLTVGEIFPAPEDPNPDTLENEADDRHVIIKKLSSCLITELDDNIEPTVNDTKLSELITISVDNTLFNTIGDTKIGGLDAKIKTLTVNDLFPAPTDGPDTRNSIIKALGSKKINELDSAVNDLTIGEIITGDFDQGILSLLYVGEAPNKLEKGYVPVVRMGEAIDNLSTTIRELSLFELVDKGLLTLDATAEARLEYTIVHGGQQKRIGDLTMKEFLETAIYIVPSTPPV